MTQQPPAPGAEPDPEADTTADGNTLSPLPGEAGIPNVAARRRPEVSKKGLLAVALMIGSLVAVVGVTVHHFAASGKRPDDAEATAARDKPTAATAEPRRPEMPPAPAASTAVAAAPRIPAIKPTAEELAESIGVRRTGAGAQTSGADKPTPPEDAPVMLVTSRPAGVTTPGTTTPRAPSGVPPGAPSLPAVPADPNDPLAATSRNLQAYQQQLQGLLENLTQTTAAATGQASGTGPTTAPLGTAPVGGPPSPGATQPSGLFGGQLQGSATPKVAATLLGNRSLTLPKGTAFTCALKTKVISATSGLVGCQVQRNVFSDDGRVLLIERGSHLDGEYRITSVKPGTVRIPVLWTRIRTPLGVTVDVESPGTGPLGESGIDGYVDNRWGERIGAAMLLSLIDDSVKLVIQNQASGQQADTIVLPSTTGNTSKLAEKVLDSTINIPPLVYQNQGGIVGIYVARDVDFSSVYTLQPTPAAPRQEGRP
ncbi:MAG: type IV secretion system protein VirB10 [Aquincola sp.]|nr:type IV secretion system protein VirB10 [Aquincola sp.]